MDPPTTSADAPVPEATSATLPPRRTGFRLATFQALRHRNYRLYFMGQIVSLTGTWMQTTAMMWLAFQLEHQSKWVGWVQAMVLLPTCLLGPWSGALADHFPKRRLLFWTQATLLVNALILTGLVLRGEVTPALLLGVALMNGLVQAVDLPTRLAFVMDMVGREDVANAVALNALLFNVARLLGPLAAGLVLFYQGPAACFLINAVSYLAVLVALLMMNVGLVRVGEEHAGKASLAAGFVYLWQRPRLLAVVLVAGTTALFGWPFLSLLPALAEHELAANGEEGYSLMLSSTGGGALLAALTVATFGSAERRQRFIVAGVLTVSLGLVLLSRTAGLPLAMACCALVGFGLILCFSSSQAVLQLSAEPHNRGKLMGIWAMTLAGSVPLGSMIIAPIADEVGVTPVLAVQGVSIGVAAVTIWLLSGFLRRNAGDDGAWDS
jgi:MFS family permease